MLYYTFALRILDAILDERRQTLISYAAPEVAGVVHWRPSQVVGNL